MTRPGRLIAVVGPSGVGKDSVIAALVAARPEITVVRRAITRPGSETEPFEPVSAAEFERRREAGAFALSWGAHGLHYGVPRTALDDVTQGREVVANLSRAVLREAAEVFGRVLILSLTARPEVLAARLATRGRETPEDVARRLARVGADLPQGVPAATVDNSGPLEETVAAVVAALDQEALS